MKIGVVADTHSLDIPAPLLKDFKAVDLIIHAGDFCSIADLKVFQKLAEVKAVYGNMDDVSLEKSLPRRIVFEVDGVSIGVVHGRGSAQQTLDFVRDEFRKDKVNVVVFGHSHIPVQKVIDGVLYLNPGSPTDKVLAPYCSYAILETNQGKCAAKIVKVS